MLYFVGLPPSRVVASEVEAPVIKGLGRVYPEVLPASIPTCKFSGRTVIGIRQFLNGENGPVLQARFTPLSIQKMSTLRNVASVRGTAQMSSGRGLMLLDTLDASALCEASVHAMLLRITGYIIRTTPRVLKLMGSCCCKYFLRKYMRLSHLLLCLPL